MVVVKSAVLDITVQNRQNSDTFLQLCSLTNIYQFPQKKCPGHEGHLTKHISNKYRELGIGNR